MTTTIQSIPPPHTQRLARPFTRNLTDIDPMNSLPVRPRGTGASASRSPQLQQRPNSAVAAAAARRPASPPFNKEAYDSERLRLDANARQNMRRKVRFGGAGRALGGVRMQQRVTWAVAGCAIGPSLSHSQTSHSPPSSPRRPSSTCRPRPAARRARGSGRCGRRSGTTWRGMTSPGSRGRCTTASQTCASGFVAGRLPDATDCGVVVANCNVHTVTPTPHPLSTKHHSLLTPKRPPPIWWPSPNSRMQRWSRSTPTRRKSRSGPPCSAAGGSC